MKRFFVTKSNFSLSPKWYFRCPQNGTFRWPQNGTFAVPKMVLFFAAPLPQISILNGILNINFSASEISLSPKWYFSLAPKWYFRWPQNGTFWKKIFGKIFLKKIFFEKFFFEKIFFWIFFYQSFWWTIFL